MDLLKNGLITKYHFDGQKLHILKECVLSISPAAGDIYAHVYQL